MTLIEAYNVYNGSDGEATKALFARLEQLGPSGAIAVNVFRAHKNSARAKVYRGGIRGEGSFKRKAYDRKEWALGNLSDILVRHAEACAIAWGWGVDPSQEYHRHVLFIDLPTGQVSFHTAVRGSGPDYAGMWDGSTEEGAGRVCRWVSQLLAPAEASA